MLQDIFNIKNKKSVATPKQIVIGLLIFFFFIGLIAIDSVYYSPNTNYKQLNFTGEILEIKKAGKGTFTIKLKTIDGKIFYVNDSKFRNYLDKINRGDSLIKISNYDCFLYKRNNIVTREACKEIFLSNSSIEILSKAKHQEY